MHAASRKGHLDVAQLLLGAGADLEAEDNGGLCGNAWKWKGTYLYLFMIYLDLCMNIIYILIVSDIIHSLLIYAISWRYDSIHMFFCATNT